MNTSTIFIAPKTSAFKAPLYVAWEITHHCNAQCAHCYSESGPDAARTNELSTEEAIHLIDQLADFGLLLLAFSGGEPMLRADWRTLVARAVTRGLGVNIGTNGSSVTAKTAAELEQLGVKSVTVSLDSHLREVHDEFRGLPSLYDKALRAISLLVEHNIRVVVGFTPTVINWTHGLDVIKLALERGAHAVNLSEYVPAGRGTLDLALSPENLRQVLSDWIGYREEFKGKIDILWHDCRVGLLVPEGEKRDYVGCGAGRLVARVLPEGTVTPCVFLPTSIGNIRQQSFTALWSDSRLLTQFRDREGHVSGNCGTCDHLNTCGGCRATANAYSNGDPLAGDPHCWIRPSDKTAMSELIEGEGLPV